MEVSAGGSAHPWPETGTCSGVTSGAASSAARPLRACSSAARTSASTSPRPTLLRVTTPVAVPSLAPTVAMTVRARPRMTPLVVSVFAAHRRLASLDSWARTMQPSAVDSCSARSTTSWVETSVLVVLIVLPPPGC